MKKLLFIIFLSISFASKAQYNYLRLEGGQNIFECIYEVDGKNSAEIERILTVNVPKIKDVKGFDKSSGVITAKIENAIIDLSLYGCKWGNTAAYVNHPFYANVSIVWKDGKYRVTLSNIEFHTRQFGVFRNTFANSDGTEFLTNKTAVRTGTCFEKYFSDLFAVNDTDSDW